MDLTGVYDPFGLNPSIIDKYVPLDNGTDGPQVNAQGALVVSFEDVGDDVYHPTSYCWYALRALSAYDLTGNEEYWRRSVATAQRLLDGADIDGEQCWLPYPFDYAPHGDSTITLHAPWYSGMAQGMALALCTRLARRAPDQNLSTSAEQIRNSFFASTDGPHVTVTDSEGLTWLEEYSGDANPLYVINGHIYAMLGLAQYAQYTNDADVINLFSRAADTLKATFTRWRVPGGISYYCASDYCKNADWTPESYHRGVARLLQTLATITGDAEFRTMGLQLDADYSA
ncbi:hypothetical protein DRB07_13340 [Actinomyces sp. Z3]|nr:hypothetical protein DRB07_13340 [Actinomyces sp. Z3]